MNVICSGVVQKCSQAYKAKTNTGYLSVEKSTFGPRSTIAYPKCTGTFIFSVNVDSEGGSISVLSLTSVTCQTDSKHFNISLIESRSDLIVLFYSGY